MKIRIRNNSVRFRLTRSEVTWLSSKGQFQGITELPGKNFVYTVKVLKQTKTMSIRFGDNDIVLTVPETFVADWPNNDKVGFYGEQLNESGSKTQLILEKDFVCLDETEEDQSDNYENPRTLH